MSSQSDEQKPKKNMNDEKKIEMHTFSASSTNFSQNKTAFYMWHQPKYSYECAEIVESEEKEREKKTHRPNTTTHLRSTRAFLWKELIIKWDDEKQNIVNGCDWSEVTWMPSHTKVPHIIKYTIVVIIIIVKCGGVVVVTTCAFNAHFSTSLISHIQSL